MHPNDAIGRDWQCGTLQVDMNLPSRFALEYVDEQGLRQPQVMLHRALFGSLERFTGILIEHHAGKLPAWLAPVQVVVLTISEAFNDYASGINTVLEAVGLRTELDISKEKVGYKIRQQTLRKVPFMAIVGANEAETRHVSLRLRNGKDLGAFSIESAVDYLVQSSKSPGMVDHMKSIETAIQLLKTA